MTEKTEDQEQQDQNAEAQDAHGQNAQSEDESGSPENPDEQMADQLVTLRDMQKSEDHLNKTMNEARDAVQAAHEADSMRSRGTEGYEEGYEATDDGE